MWFLIRRTRLGYEARAVGSVAGIGAARGASRSARRSSGCSSSRARSPDWSGCSRSWPTAGTCRRTTSCALGFTGIAVAFLGQNNPIGIIFAAILWGSCRAARSALQIESEVPREFIIILQGILILSVVITYQIAKRRLAARQLQRAGEAGALEDSAARRDGRPEGPSHGPRRSSGRGA